MVAWLYWLKEHTWNAVLSKIEEVFWGRTPAGDQIFNELRQMAPDVYAISLKMKALGFQWSSDPLGGMLDYHSAPRVTCARKRGDCDDWSHLWAEILKGHGNVWILTTFSTEGKGHSMCVFEKGGQFALLSNLDIAVVVSKREQLDKYFYGDKTKISIYYSA